MCAGLRMISMPWLKKQFMSIRKMTESTGPVSSNQISRPLARTEGGIRVRGNIKQPLPDKPLLTVITVVFNGALTLEHTICSVMGQTYGNVEHIIIDGGSTDATLSILRKYDGNIDYWVSEKDEGLYDAMNKGLALASGDYVGMLNADDVYADDTVLSQAAAVFADSTVDACFADLVYVDQHDPGKIVRYWKSCGYREGLFERGWMPAHPTFFVRRKLYEQHGGFDPDFPRQADFDLAMRFLAVHKIKSVYVPEVWVRMRMGGVSNNSIGGVIKGNVEAYKICHKNGLKVTPLFIFTKMASRIPQFFKRPG